MALSKVALTTAELAGHVGGCVVGGAAWYAEQRSGVGGGAAGGDLGEADADRATEQVRGDVGERGEMLLAPFGQGVGGDVLDAEADRWR